PVGVITRGSLLRWASNMFRAQIDSVSPGAQNHHCDATGCEAPRQRIARTASVVVREGEKLEQRMIAGGNDLTPCVIGAASRLQELVNDLLACSRYANDDSDDDLSHEAESLLRGHDPLAAQQGAHGLLAFERAQSN
ncbi:MAG TPA: hypothetical protein VL096_14045, partial [Pirellulaceae bacterium]|nr:hypothetical protein [Pirellulaceae bacterium]